MMREVEIPDEFSVLEFVTWKDFETISSVGFFLGLWEPLIRNGDEARGGSFHSHGRLEVHYPCDPAPRARIRVDFDQERELTEPTMRDLVRSILEALRIPDGESYSFTYTTRGTSWCVESGLCELIATAGEVDDDSG